MSLLSLGRPAITKLEPFPWGLRSQQQNCIQQLSEQILAKHERIGGSTCAFTCPSIRDREGTDVKGWGVLLKGRNVLISPVPVKIAQAFRHLLVYGSFLLLCVSCLSAVECDIQRAGGTIRMLQVLTLVAILSSTQLCSSPKGSLWTGALCLQGYT